MTPADIKREMEKLHWSPRWRRPLEAFMLSLFQESMTRECMRTTGVDAGYRAEIFQNGVWYESREVRAEMRADIERYLVAGGSIVPVSASCERHWERSRERIIAMRSEEEDHLLGNLAEFARMVNQVHCYMHLTYGFEDAYTERLDTQVAALVPALERENFIRRVSVPSKKNAYALMEDALRSPRDLASIRDEFGWLKSRDGFSDGFTLEELAEHRWKLSQEESHEAALPMVPEPMREIVAQVQELIYFRTLRGDARLNLLFLMRPLLRKVAEKYAIPFTDFPHYSAYDLAAGTPVYYPSHGTFLFYGGEMLYSQKPFVVEETPVADVIRGQTGCGGVARGTVRVVTKTADLAKVQEGDVFVAQQTFPAFIIGLRKAAAFVTDEGGITCHAAIIAREMKKPCIIGTGSATKIFKDGDVVEVDADRGVVRRL